MIRQKKKLSHKEMKEDKLITFYYQTIDLFDKYKKFVLIGGAGVVVVAALVFLYITNQKTNNETASVELARMTTIYDAGSYAEAIDGKPNTKLIGFKKIVSEYGGTENGQSAKIYLANSLYNLGKFDEAMKAYDDYSGKNELLKATSYAGMASCFDAKKEFEKAAGYYTKAAEVSKDNVLNPKYLLNAAINYLNLKKNDNAKELFAKIKRDYSKSPFSKDLERYSSLVN